MFTLIAIIIIIACVLLTLVVLIQNPKGGGIAANFIAPQQIMGAKRSTDVVEKATWILGVMLISFSLLSNFFRPIGEPETVTPASRLNEKIDETEIPTTMPPATTPVQPETQPADTN